MKPIPIGVSGRHIHLSQKDFEILFGKGETLHILKELSQPLQFAALETVLLSNSAGEIKNVRILGPFRKQTQVELAKSDAVRIKLNPPVRDSGDLEGSEAVEISGPKGKIYLRSGVILPYRHIHMTPEDANYFKLKDKEVVSVSLLPGKNSLRNSALRRVIFQDVLIRINKDYRLDFHIDTDEANAALISTGDFCQIEEVKGYNLQEKIQASKNKVKNPKNNILIDEEAIYCAHKNHQKIKIKPGLLITPSAKSLGSRLGVLVE